MRLIDADTIFNNKLLLVRAECYDAVRAVVERINNAPTVDAEPVVRCKDCEHWGLHRTWLKGNEVYMQDCFINEMMTKPDFFCAGGEKKGECK